MTKPYEAAVHEIKRLCLGEDPLRVTALWQKIFEALYLPTNRVPLRAMAGIEVACWDILGQFLGQPVHALLGGQVRDRVRIYANGWYQGPRNPEVWAEQAREVVSQGYTALKFDPFGSNYRDLPKSEEKLTYAIVGAIKEAVGSDVDLLIEAHDRFDTSTAVRIGHWLKDFGVTWYEAPVIASDVEALVSVAKQVPVPVATGERFTTLTDFGRLLSHDVISIIQPELLTIGGLWRMIQVAGLCQAYHASLAPHNSESPLKTLINAHVCAVTPNLLIEEVFDDFLIPWSRDLVKGSAEIKNGYLEIPCRPGIGATLDEAEATRHPYSEHNFMNLFERGWEMRGQH
jgi:galactonate dehydratase